MARDIEKKTNEKKDAKKEEDKVRGSILHQTTGV